jgi:uncharacterized protein YcbX
LLTARCAHPRREALQRNHPSRSTLDRKTKGASTEATQTIASLGELVGARLDVQRFRPNILVEPINPVPFVEDGWVGCVLRVGSMRMRVDKRDGRCAVITIDPLTTERNPAILRTVARDRGGCLGVYGSTVQPGRVAIGDPVAIESAA